MTEHNHNRTAPAYLSPADVAHELRLSVSAIYNLIRCGDLLAIDVAPTRGRCGHAHYRISRASLDEFLARRNGTGAVARWAFGVIFRLTFWT
jgi:predicted DNA-binding transcriptional regulator AlpA